MLDNALIKELRTTLLTGLTSLGKTTVKVKQAYQPTEQGVNTAPTIYLFKISDERVGYPYREDHWDVPNSLMVHTEFVPYVTTFQVGALVKQVPNSITAETASDLVNYASYILQSEAALNYLRSKDLGILPIKNIRNLYFIDSENQYEASPSFDFQISHKQVIVTSTPVIETIELNIERI